MSLSDITELRQGDVVLVRFPFTDLSGKKLRPAVLVSNTGKIRGRDGHFIFCSSQSSLEGRPGVVTVHAGTADARAMRLKFPRGSRKAYVVSHKIMTLEIGLVARRLGSATARLMDVVTGELAEVLEREVA